MNTKIILSIIAVVAIIAINPLLGTPSTPTHEECVAYWTTRTASWNNAPSMDTIHNSASYCGDIL